MFNKEAWHNVEDCKLRVLYMAPPRPLSPVREGSEEGFSPRASVSDNRNISAEISAASRGFVGRYEPQDNSSEARTLISKLTEEKNYVMKQNSKLQQELVDGKIIAPTSYIQRLGQRSAMVDGLYKADRNYNSRKWCHGSGTVWWQDYPYDDPFDDESKLIVL